MAAEDPNDDDAPRNAAPSQQEWGALPDDNFGYRSEEERRARRGLEDWELLEGMSKTQPGVFDWLHTVVGAVIAGILIFALTAYGVYYIAYHYGPVLLNHKP